MQGERDQADRRPRGLPGRRSRRADQRVERNHLTLLAATEAGFRNLVKLTSAGFLEGFGRGKPSVDTELLDRHADGVIALTGCLQSRFCRRLIEERPADARAHLDELLGVFGPENVYFEIQANGLAEQEKANEGIVRVAERARPPAGGDGRRPLPAPRGLLEPRGASLRADEVHDRAAQAAVRDQRVLPQEPGRDGGVVLPLAGVGGDHARDRRALRGRDRARPAAAAPVPDARTARSPPRCSGGSPPRGCAASTATRRRPRPSSGSSSSSG